MYPASIAFIAKPIAAPFILMVQPIGRVNLAISSGTPNSSVATSMLIGSVAAELRVVKAVAKTLNPPERNFLIGRSLNSLSITI